jgi:anti-sigma B factor antagonist
MVAPAVDPYPSQQLVATPLDEQTELLELAGEFDAYMAPRLEEQLLAAIDSGRTEVVIDVTQVTFVDVSTLNCIVRALKRAYQRNGHVVLAGNQRVVLRAIDLAGLRHALRVYSDRAEALAALRRR